MNKCIFGIDVGGTQIKIGKFVNDELVLKFAIDTDTSDEGKNIISDIGKVIRDNLGDCELLGIGVGIPGPVHKGIVLGAQNIGWEIVDAKSLLEEEFPGTTIELMNDANAAVLGEYYCGSAKGYPNIVMLTLGTGVGGGIIINEKVYEGANGSSGELGHLQMEKGGRPCSCGLHGCLEQYVSATGVLKTAHIFREGKDTLLNKENLTCKEVFDFAKAGDKVAMDVVEDMTEKLAIGCADICNTLNPDLLLIGGGVSRAGDFMLDKVKEKFLDYSFYSIRNTEFKIASLGNDAGIYGDYFAVKRKINENNNL